MYVGQIYNDWSGEERMKIIKYNYGKANDETFTIQEAVEYAATPGAYFYSDELEKIKYENEKLREIVVRLIECIYGKNRKKFDQIEYILGHGFRVEE